MWMSCTWNSCTTFILAEMSVKFLVAEVVRVALFGNESKNKFLLCATVPAFAVTTYLHLLFYFPGEYGLQVVENSKW